MKYTPGGKCSKAARWTVGIFRRGNKGKALIPAKSVINNLRVILPSFSHYPKGTAMALRTTVKSRPKSKAKHKTRRITIEPADNGGFSVNHELQAPESAPGGPYIPPPPDEHTVHEDQAGMLSRVKELTGGGTPDAGPDDSAPAGGDQES